MHPSCWRPHAAYPLGQGVAVIEGGCAIFELTEELSAAPPQRCSVARAYRGVRTVSAPEKAALGTRNLDGSFDVGCRPRPVVGLYNLAGPPRAIRAELAKTAGDRRRYDAAEQERESLPTAVTLDLAAPRGQGP